MQSLTLRFLFISLFLSLMVSAAWAQDADLSGLVRDASGAVIPNATVNAIEIQKGTVRTAQTNQDGLYALPYLQSGVYDVDVSAQGFQKMTRSNLKLEVAEHGRADFTLEVGTVKQNVTVAADAAQVETASTQLGEVIEDKKMQDLPLNGRSYLDLMSLQAGVVPLSAMGNGRTVSGTITGDKLSINGAREDANAFLVNGSSVEETHVNSAAVVPTLDAIQEFRILTNSFDAEYGFYSGGVVSVVTKSGTNQIHGTVFDFLRNNDMAARNFFARDQVSPYTGQIIPGSAIAVLQENQWGFVVGGPILKDRLFFFGDYQGTHQLAGSSAALISVPSAGEEGGNFSDVGTTGYKALTGIVRGDNNPADGTMSTVLTQRLGYTVMAGEPYWTPGCTSQQDALSRVCVFPNQVIPQTAWDPAAIKLASNIPAPTGVRSTGRPFWSSTAYKTLVTDAKFAPRIDLATQRAGNWAFYYNYDDAVTSSPFGYGSFPGYGTQSLARGQQLNVSNTKIFGPTAVNEFRINFYRFSTPAVISKSGLGPLSQFGFQGGGLGIVPTEPSREGLPQIVLSQLGIKFGLSPGEAYIENGYEVSDGFSKVSGKHTLKFGGSATRSQFNEWGTGSPNGYFAFNGSETGNDFADFLIGAPSTYEQQSFSAYDSWASGGAVYAQDSYRARPHLTINYGLRWEVQEPWYDEHGRDEAFVPGEQSVVFPNSPTGWLVPGDPGIPSTIAPTRYKDFAPRLGIAYSPRASSGWLKKILGGPDKTSIRAATGIFYTTISHEWQGWELGDPPFANSYTSSSLVYLNEPFKSRTSGNNPGQRFPATPVTSTLNFSQFLPISADAYQTTNVVPYDEDYNFTIQREIPHSAIVSIGYVGTQGHHLFSEFNFNPGNAATCLAIRNAFIAAGQSGGGCGPNGEDTIYTLNGQAYYGTRPYSVTSGRYLSQGLLDFASNTYLATMANSSYNSLQITLNKATGPVQFLAAYTFSKALDNSSDFEDLINPYNYNRNKALSGFDMTHNFVVSYSYELPLRRLAFGHTGAARKILEGWQLSGITHFSTGLGIPLSETGDRSLCGCENFGNANGSVDLPNWNGQRIQVSNPRTSAGFDYFSTSTFSVEQLGVPGDANRRFFHGPGLNNWDMSLFKNVRLTERFSLDIRAEFFNIFNHAQFSLPVANFSSASFGDVTSAYAPRIGQVAMKLHF